ncbi:MAG: GIY-YIG nuclease family protein [Paludibacteraceae bacterium]|nr:GIY-YIG nuclease family protein [Paludibacteraceae bacterium]
MGDKFSKSACKKLNYYVYRLVDPRTGSTFYVGKGKNNRVFAHAKDALKAYEGDSYLEKDEDEVSAKIRQIRNIHKSGLKVNMVIHRWGLDEKTAFEVEAALIDAYTSLTNIQLGHHWDRGAIEASALQEKFGMRAFNDRKAEANEYIIIKIRQKVLKSHSDDVYKTARKAWVIDPKKAQQYKYVLVSLDSEVVGIFKDVKWKRSSIPGRYEFDAVELDNKLDKTIIKRYMHKLLPKRYTKKGISNPVLYQSKI